jgi:hypothetical protein
LLAAIFHRSRRRLIFLVGAAHDDLEHIIWRRCCSAFASQEVEAQASRCSLWPRISSLGLMSLAAVDRDGKYQHNATVCLYWSRSIFNARYSAATNEGIKVVRGFLPAAVVFAAVGPAKLIALRCIKLALNFPLEALCKDRFK